MVSYVVLLIRMGNNLAGAPTIPELITKHRSDYFAALDAADLSLREKNQFDLTAMQMLLTSLLAKQLTTVMEIASGSTVEELIEVLNESDPLTIPASTQ